MDQPYVKAKNLSKSFGKKLVLNQLSFEVGPGDIVGVLGKNGAGKTTLLELILGFTPASDGHVEVFGHESYRLPRSAKQRVGFVPQQDELINQLNCADQLRLISSFYSEWDEELINRFAKKWDLNLNERVKNLSVGQRQALSILLSLGHRPDLLILDEPVASLDPIARRNFLEQIVEVAADGNRSVIFSSHIVSDIERLANKIWIIKDNQLYWSGDFDDLKDSIVRIHLHSPSPIDAALNIPNAISVERTENTVTAVVHDWDDDSRKKIEASTDAEIAVEELNLEDIFLELHR